MSFDAEFIRAKVISDFPLFIDFVLPIPLVEDSSINTMCTDGVTIRYNGSFINSLSVKEQYCGYLHELAHIFLGHHLRITPDMDQGTAGTAADIVANDLLLSGNIDLPSWFVIDHRFSGCSFEEVYAALLKKTPRFPDKRDGGVPQNPPDMGDEALEEHRKKQLSAIAQATLMGSIPGTLERTLNALTESKKDWKDIFPAKISEILGDDDYSFLKPDHRYSNGDFILPGMVGESAKTAVLILDTSGSNTKDQLSLMASDIVDVIQNVEPEKIYVLSVDSKMQGYQIFTREDTDIELKLKGGGGTDFRPGFEWIEHNVEEDIGVVVYLTDGYCSMYPKSCPPYDVIWLVYGKNFNFSPPFGDVIRMG